jgi:hypothetical protein
MHQHTAPYAWLAWLGERDAQVLLLTLMQAIDQECDPATLRAMVTGWRRNALTALTADNWRAKVDGYLEVWVDARLAALQRPGPDDDLDRGQT